MLAMRSLTARRVLNCERYAGDHKNHSVSDLGNLLVQLPEHVPVNASASKRRNYPATHFVRNNNHGGLREPDSLRDLIQILEDAVAASPRLHEVGQVKREAVDNEHVGLRAPCLNRAFQIQRRFEGVPKCRPFRTVSSYLAPHLRVTRSRSGNKSNTLKVRS